MKEREVFINEMKYLITPHSRDTSEFYLPEEMKKLPENITKWFDTKKWKPPHEITSGNKVTALIDGVEAFKSMADAIRSANSDTDFIYFANWRMELDFRLKPEFSWSTIRNLFKEASKNKVEICGLLSKDLLGNYDENKLNWTKEHELFFKHLEFARVIPDRVFLPLGLHHQKILIVKARDSYGKDRLVAFCGGVDFANSRLPERDRIFEKNSSSTKEKGIRGHYHDIHCKIEGPAARQLLKLFCDRWLDNPFVYIGSYSSKFRGKDYLDNISPEPQVKGNDMFVQIGTTFGNGTLADARKNSILRVIKLIMDEGGILLKNKIVAKKIRSYFMKYKGQVFTKIEGNQGDYYSFAKNGDMTAYWMIIKAIGQAKNYIYLEDQYLVAANLIAKKLNEVINDPNKPNLKIIIVIPDSSITTDIFTPYRLRGEFIKTLTANKNSAGYKYPHSRVSVCYRKVELDHNYVHSKTWIFDDKYAIIGSANCSNRGYTHDSEVVAGIYDRKVEESYTSRCNQQYDPKHGCPFAKELRIRLWKHHLNLESPIDLSQEEVKIIMDDSEKSLRYWFDLLPRDAYVRPVPLKDVLYKENVDWKDIAVSISKSVGKWEIDLPKNLVKLIVLASGQIDPRGY